MNKQHGARHALRLGLIVIGLMAAQPGVVRAHCDTLDGPVVKEAQACLERGDVTPLLKWVRPADEAEIREAFEKARAVRTKGDDARELADRYFLENLVRVHRAGEGAPYTGLKPAGAELVPAVREADAALENGHVDKLVDLVTGEVARGLRARHARAVEARKHAAESVALGREFVEAYVKFIHYAEGIYLAATSDAAHHGEGAKPAGEAHDHAAQGEASSEKAGSGDAQAPDSEHHDEAEQHAEPETHDH